VTRDRRDDDGRTLWMATAAARDDLDERVGSHTGIHYLPPNAPRGPADQLHTPELREAAARK